jgi:hypothetical protein
MNAKLLFRFILMGLMLSALVLAGCDDGDDGRDGRDGADGASAYEIAVENGFDGTEQEWLDSLQGEDATLTGESCAVENGFDGTEQEWLDSLQGEDATLTGESCNVCHGVSSQIGLAIDEQHPEVAEKPIVSIYNITRTGDLLTVYINAVDSEGDPVEGVGLVSPSSGSDLRVYMADIVPAGTVTANSPVSEWTTAYPERWAADRGNTPGVVISEPTPGNYVFKMVTPVTEIGGPEAPEGDPTHKQRVYVRVDPRDFGELNRSIAVADFDLPADGGSTGPVSGTTRTIVAQSACTSCHGDPLQRASHGGGYQSPQVCVMCHSPIGSVPEFEGEAFESTLGDEMQLSGFWLAALIHGIHTSQVLPGWIDDNEFLRGTTIPNPDYGKRVPQDFSEVTYPQNIAECSVCHFDDPDEDQDLVDNWKTNPSAEACNTCHNVDFTTGDGHGENNIGGPQENANCTLCHPAEKGGVGGAVAESHEVDYDADNLLYETTISLSPDADNDGVYIVGETILVTTTVDYPDFDYLNEDTDFLREATLYVYGPRALAVPVLTPGSTTDPDYVDPEVTPPGTPPDQGRGMLITAQADDPLVMTDASGFKYQLLEITEGMEGTYMVQSKIDFSAPHWSSLLSARRLAARDLPGRRCSRRR